MFNWAQGRLTDEDIAAILARAQSHVDENVKKTKEKLKERLSPGDLFSLLRLPMAGAEEMTLLEEKFEQAIEDIIKLLETKTGENRRDFHLEERLTPSQFEALQKLNPCNAHRKKVKCEGQRFHRKYRSIDGTCNNYRFPLWGSSLTALDRFLPARYEDGLSEPVGWKMDKLYNGYLLPSPRLVSNKVMSTSEVNHDEKHTDLVMHWGQFLDHDIDSTPISASTVRFSDGVPCNETCTNERPCFPIQIPTDDPRIDHRKCMGFTRSGSVCGSGRTSIFGERFIKSREQLNQITSFIDASQVYGSTAELEKRLRDLTNDLGLLKEGVEGPNGSKFLPFDEDGREDCQITNAGHRDPVKCFLAGDHRPNENLGLIALHTIFVRHHNKLAKSLKTQNPHWCGEKVYQETRKIIGAQMQHISYAHYLPIIIGPSGMEQLGPYDGYDKYVSPAVVNAFSTAAFRFGHGQVLPIVYRLNDQFEEYEYGNIRLAQASFASFRVIQEGGLDPIIRGMHHIGVKKMDPENAMSSGVTEHLFKLRNDIALDLAALNTQRGRDHGLPSYNAFREKCGLNRAYGFGDLAREIKSTAIRQKLGEVYGHPDNIDLFVGGMVEDQVEGGTVGPTFQCILVEQFRRLRSGDRFWYEKPGVFTRCQLKAIKETTLSSIVCDNSDGSINRIQEDMFAMVDSVDDYKPCDEIKSLNIKPWKDK